MPKRNTLQGRCIVGAVFISPEFNKLIQQYKLRKHLYEQL